MGTGANNQRENIPLDTLAPEKKRHQTPVNAHDTSPLFGVPRVQEISKTNNRNHPAIREFRNP